MCHSFNANILFSIHSFRLNESVCVHKKQQHENTFAQNHSETKEKRRTREKKQQRKKIKEREIYNETSHKFYPCFSFRVHRVLFWDFLLASNGKRSWNIVSGRLNTTLERDRLRVRMRKRTIVAKKNKMSKDRSTTTTTV